MTERKKIKLEKAEEEAKELLDALQNMKKDNDEDFAPQVSKAVGFLNSKDTKAHGILAISQIFRKLQSPEDALPMLLDASELRLLFNSVHFCLMNATTDLSPFTLDVFFSDFKDFDLISKFFKISPTHGPNREVLKEMLVLFIKFNPERRDELIQMVLGSKTHLDLVPRISQYVECAKLDEETYLRMFHDCPLFRESAEFRVIRGKNKLEFIQKAIETHPMDVYSNYSRDRDQNVRLFLAKKVTFTNEPFFKILLNDHEDEVRLTLLRRMSGVDAPLDVAERSLDKAAKVRAEVFRIFHELVHYMRILEHEMGLNIFDRALQSPVEDGKLMFKPDLQSVSQDELYEKFKLFFAKVCLGCLTCLKDEYFTEIKKCKFSLEFLNDNKKVPGLAAYLKTLEMTTLEGTPMHLRGLALEYMFKGSLSIAEIIDCIRGGVFECLKHIQEPRIFFDVLLEKALSISDLRNVEAICGLIGPLLRDQKCSRLDPKQAEPADDTVVEAGSICVSENPGESHTVLLTPNELFVNAHTKLSEREIERQLTSLEDPVDYPHLYFLVWKRPDMVTTDSIIEKSQVSLSQKIRLLLYLNDPKHVEPHVDSLLKRSLDHSTQEILCKNRSLVSTLIYFYCTGLVKVSSPTFFITAIKYCLLATNEAKIDFVFKKYMKSVSRATFNSFYSICCLLKGYCVTDVRQQRHEHREVECSLLLNPPLVEDLPELSDSAIPLQRVDEMASKAAKLMLSKQDKMLFYICNTIISSRDGDNVDVRFNPEAYGFHKLEDYEAQLISIGQVIYE